MSEIKPITTPDKLAHISAGGLGSPRPALIIGSGPSVDRLKPEWLSLFETYGCNSVYRKFTEWERSVDNVVVTDSNRLREIGTAYSGFKGRLFVGDQHYISPPISRYRKILGRDFIPLRQLTKNSLPVNSLTRMICWPKYLATTVFDKLSVSFDYTERGINFGRSVSASAVQIAAAHGHKRIFLIGIDASYPTEKAYFRSMVNTVEHVNRSFVANPRLMMEPFFVMIQIELERIGATLTDLSNGSLRFVPKSDLYKIVEELSAV